MVAQMAVANPTWRKSEISVDVLVNMLLLTCLRYEFSQGRKVRGLVWDMLPLRYHIQVQTNGKSGLMFRKYF